MAKRLRIEEASVFATPLPTWGYSVVLVAGCGRWPFIQSAAFLARFRNKPSLEEAVDSIGRAPYLTVIHGPQAIGSGLWTRLGRLEGFRRADWVGLRQYNVFMDSVVTLDERSLLPVSNRRAESAQDRDLPLEATWGDLSISGVVECLLDEGALERLNGRRRADFLQREKIQNPGKAGPLPPEQCAELRIPLGDGPDRSSRTEKWLGFCKELDQVARRTGVGRVDGCEVNQDDITIRMYGESAHVAGELASNMAAQLSLPPGSTLSLRRGSPGDANEDCHALS